MKFNLTIILDKNPSHFTNMSLNAIKIFIRRAQKDGYKIDGDKGRFSHFVVNTRVDGGLPLVKNTCQEFSTIGIFLKAV